VACSGTALALACHSVVIRETIIIILNSLQHSYQYKFRPYISRPTVVHTTRQPVVCIINLFYFMTSFNTLLEQTDGHLHISLSLSYKLVIQSTALEQAPYECCSEFTLGCRKCSD
jgi:hypothetical protein